MSFIRPSQQLSQILRADDRVKHNTRNGQRTSDMEGLLFSQMNFQYET